MKDLRLAWVLVFTGVSAACGVADDGSAPSLDEVQQALFVSVPARVQAESYERDNELRGISTPLVVVRLVRSFLSQLLHPSDKAVGRLVS